MPEGSSSASISLRLPIDVLEQLDQIASTLERPRSWVCVRALRKYLAEEGAEILDVQQGITQLDRGEAASFEEVIADLREVIEKAESKRTAE
jgi:predicted transcriptional regulator